jgi:hypothetical protein
MVEAEVASTLRLRRISLHKIGEARACPLHDHAPPLDALEFCGHLGARQLSDGIETQHQRLILGRDPLTRSAPTRSGFNVGESLPALK